MADELKIIVKAVLDKQDIKEQAKSITDLTVPVRISIDKAELKKQIDSVSAEIAKLGNGLNIHYGINKSEIAKQARVAGQEAKKELERAVAGSGGVHIATKIDKDAVKTLRNELSNLGFNEANIASATKGLEEQRIKVKEIATTYESVKDAQTGIQAITIKGVDAQNKQVTLVQRFNAAAKELEQTQIRVVAKLNEQGEIVGNMATKLRTKDTPTIRAEEAETLEKFISNIKKANLFTGEMKETVDSLKASLASAFTEPALKEYLNQFGIAQKHFQALKAEESRTAASPVAQIDKNTAALSRSLSFDGMKGDTGGIAKLRGELNALVSEYARLRAAMVDLDPASNEFEALAEQVDALDARFKSATRSAEIFNGSFSNNNKLAGITAQIERAQSRLSEREIRWSQFKHVPELADEFNKLKESVQGLDALNLQNFNKQLSAFDAHVKQMGADTLSFTDSLKNALSKFGIWMSASTIFMQVWRSVKAMVQSVKELDAALVEFNKVADLSNSELADFVDTAFELGDSLGRTGTEVVQAAAIFKQAGYDIKESLALSESALIMKNVSENIESTASAASDLIAVMKGYGMAVNESMNIVDMINNVSNNLPISFGDLDEGLTRVSGTLAQTGTSIQETIGLLTGGFASLRNIEKVSTGLIQISQRLRGIGEDGEAIDGLAPRLQAMFKEIAGIDIEDVNGELRSTYDIIVDLAKASEQMTSKERQLIFQEAAGTRQVSVLNAIVANINDVQKAVDSATNSAGSAMLENEKFLDSIQGKTNQLISSFQELSSSTIDSGLVKFFIDIANMLVKAIDGLGIFRIALIAVLTSTKLFNGVSNIFKTLTSWIISLPQHLTRAANSMRMFGRASQSFIGPMPKMISSTQVALVGIVAAISLVTASVNAYTAHIEKEKQRAEEIVSTWQEANEAYATNKKTVEEISADFSRLSSGVDSFGNNLSLTSDEFKKYHDISNKVANMFPELVSGYDDQGNAILSVKGNVEDLTKALEDQASAANHAAIAGSDIVFRATKRAISSGGGFLGLEQTGALTQIETIDEVVSSLRDMDGTLFKSFALFNENVAERFESLKDIVDATGVGLFVDSSGFSIKQGADVLNIERQLLSYRRGLEIQAKSAAADVLDIVSAYLSEDEAYNLLSRDVQSILVRAISQLDAGYISSHSSISGLLTSIFSDIIEPIGENGQLANEILSAVDLSDDFRAGKISVDLYAEAISNLKKELAEAGIKGDIASIVINDVEVDGVGALVKNVQNKLNPWERNKVSSMTLSALGAGAELKVDDSVLLSWEEFNSRLYDTQTILSSLTIGEHVDAIANAASVANKAFSEQGHTASITREQYNSLVEAGEEYAAVVDNNNGYLSVNKQKLDEIIKSKQKEERAYIASAKASKLQEFDENTKKLRENAQYTKYLEAAKSDLGAEYDALAKKAKDEYDSLINSQDAIRKEISNYDLLASELEYATSAYKRWLDAKSGPEAGDGYDELSNAWKAIEEGLESGKVGTAKFKAAESLLIPEEVSAQGKEAIAKYKKSVMKYFTEDSSGLSTFVDDLAEQGFLSLGADGQYLTTAKANVEDIAASLNLSKDAVEMMLIALRDYDWDIDISDPAYETAEAIKQYKEAEDALAEAQKNYDKAVSSGESAEAIANLNTELEKAKENFDKVSEIDISPSLSTEESLSQQIAEMQASLNELSLHIPSDLEIDLRAEIAALQEALYADASAILKARIAGDPTLLEEKIRELQSPNDADGNPKSGIRLLVDLERSKLYTENYNAIISDREGLQAPIQTTVTVGTGDATIDAHINSEPAKIECDNLVAELEKKTVTIGVEYTNKDGDLRFTSSDSNEYGGRGGSLGAPDSPFAPLVREAVASERAGFQEIDQWVEHLEGKLGDLYNKQAQFNEQGFELPEIDLALLEEYKKQLDEIAKPVTTPVGADTSEAGKELDKLRQDASNTTLKVPIDIVVRTGGGGKNVLQKYASGTKKAKRGTALTGEEGVETVITKDGFYTVGHDGPELVNLQGGEEILDNENTRKLLRGSRKQMSGQAFSRGTNVNALMSDSGGSKRNLLSSAFEKLKDYVKDGIDALGKAFANVGKAFANSKSGFTGGGSAIGGENQNKKGGGGGRSTGSVAEAVEEAQEEIKKDFEDWIPRLLERVRKETDKIIESSEKRVKFSAKNSELDRAIANNEKLIMYSAQASERYMKQANQVANKWGMSRDVLDKIHNGTIDIELYQDDTRQIIADYKKWYDLAESTRDTIAGIKKEQEELAKTKLDNIQSYYQNRIGVYGDRVDIATTTIELGQATGRETKRSDYDGILRDVNAQLALLRRERADFEATFTELVTSGVIRQGSDDWHTYTGRIAEMDKSILDASLSLDKFNDIARAIAIDNLNVAIKYLNTVQGTLESVQGLRAAQGRELTATDYKQLISVGMQQVKTLEAQNAELMRQQKGLDILSSEYQQIQDQIDDNLNGIWNIKTSQEGWNDAIVDLNINALKKASDQYNRQLETMRAIEELEKAKQRRNLVYRDNVGFRYEADANAIRDAEQDVDRINLDNLIDALESSKGDDNVYDASGKLLGKRFTGLDSVNFDRYTSSVFRGNETSELLVRAIKDIDWSAIKTAGAGANTVEFNGGINLYGVNDVKTLAGDIKSFLPSYITQGMYKKG